MRYALLVLLCLATPAYAYDPGGELPNASEEARARDLFRELRCMVCQNQSIDDSDAPLAKDLRTLVRERVAAGDSNEDIKNFLVSRYGEFVLLRPQLGVGTLLLWGTPVIVILGGAALLLVRGRRKAAEERLSAEEERKLRAALGEEA